jgi:cold shock protein
MQQQQQQDRFHGRVKFYKPEQGWGFIEPSTGGKDIFVHVHEITRSGVMGPLVEHQPVEYGVADSGPKKPGMQKAVDIKAEPLKLA